MIVKRYYFTATQARPGALLNIKACQNRSEADRAFFDFRYRVTINYNGNVQAIILSELELVKPAADDFQAYSRFTIDMVGLCGGYISRSMPYWCEVNEPDYNPDSVWPLPAIFDFQAMTSILAQANGRPDELELPEPSYNQDQPVDYLGYERWFRSNFGNPPGLQSSWLFPRSGR